MPLFDEAYIVTCLLDDGVKLYMGVGYQRTSNMQFAYGYHTRESAQKKAEGCRTMEPSQIAVEQVYSSFLGLRCGP
jgi:hypothetical protein